MGINGDVKQQMLTSFACSIDDKHRNGKWIPDNDFRE
jgi:hypothetical protein